jgi:hypothetical protein
MEADRKLLDLNANAVSQLQLLQKQNESRQLTKKEKQTTLDRTFNLVCVA